MVAATVFARSFPRGAHGQQPGLGQGDIANGLTLPGEVKLFFFLALVFGHGGIIKSTADLVVKAGDTRYHRPKFQAKLRVAKQEPDGAHPQGTPVNINLYYLDLLNHHF